MKLNWTGKEVWNHIMDITPDEDDVPTGFKKIILPRKFTYQAYDVESLLKTDDDFKEYYKSGHDRYRWEEKRPSDLDLEIVVVNGELLDGYSRVSELLRAGKKVTNAFVASDKIQEAKKDGDSCWKGYRMIGMKDKKGKKVPNCVPIKEAKETYSDYPAAAKSNAKKAIDWKEKYGRDEVKGGTEVGWQRAHQLAKGESLSRDVVSRMAQFNRHRKNSKVAAEHKDEPWKDNGYIAWLIWGGDEGVDWAMKKMDQINKEEANEKKIYTMKHLPLFEQFVSESKSSKELASRILNTLDDSAQLHSNYVPKEALDSIESALKKYKNLAGKDAEKAAKQIRINLEDMGILSNTFSPFDVELMIMNNLNEKNIYY